MGWKKKGVSERGKTEKGEEGDYPTGGPTKLDWRSIGVYLLSKEMYEFE